MTTQKQYGDFFARIFPDLTNYAVWSTDKQPNEDVKGAGVLIDSASVLAGRIDAMFQNGRTVHIGLTGYEKPNPTTGFFYRRQMLLGPRYAVVLDVDYKDNPGVTPADIIQRINNAALPASGAFATSNGLHLYYLFNHDVTTLIDVIHAALSAHMGKYGVVVDTQAGRTLRGAIRAPGSMGKCGTMRVEGDTSGPTYDHVTLPSMLGVPPFAPTAANYSFSGVDDRTNLGRALASMQPVARRTDLEHHCAAYRKFVELGAATAFDAGMRGGYADARMFASLAAKSTHADDTSPAERRTFGISTMMQWPGSDESWCGNIYDGVVASGSPAFRCDKWGPAFSVECAGCPNQGKGGNPISFVNDQARVSAPVPASAAPPAVLTFVPAGSKVAPALPENYFVGNDYTLFQTGVKEVKGKPVPYSTPICTPAFSILSRAVTVGADDNTFVTGESIQGYVVQAANRTDTQWMSSKVLNNSSALSDECSTMGVLIRNHKILQEYVSDCSRSCARDVDTATALGWVSSKEALAMPGYLIEHNVVREISMSSSLENMLGKDNTARGNPNDWVTNVLQPLASRPELFPHMLMLLSSFACPLYALIQSDSGPFISLVGGGQVGKTTSVKLGAGVWHDPDKMTLTVNDTDAGRMNRISTMRHMPITFDEVTACDPDMLYKIIYLFTAGMDKAAMGEPGKQRAVGTWQSCVLASSNKPLRTLIAGRAQDNGAVYDRVLDIMVPEKARSETNKQVLQHCESHGASNRGVSGMHWAVHLIANREDIAKNAVSYVELRSSKGHNRFAARHFGMLDCVATEFVRMGWLAQQQADDFKGYVDQLMGSMAQRKKELVSQATITVADFLDYFHGSILPRDANKAHTMCTVTYPIGFRIPEPALTIYEDHDGYYFSRALIARYLRDFSLRTNFAAVLDQWAIEMDKEKVPQVRGRFPVPNVLIAGPAVTIDMKQARRYFVPKGLPNDKPQSGPSQTDKPTS